MSRPATRTLAFDRILGHLLGEVVWIDGDQITYKPVGVPSFVKMARCWLTLWEG